MPTDAADLRPDSGSADLATPVLLIAMPQVQDPFFHKSVVLLLHHSEEGSVGLIVNRPTELAVREILAGMELEWHGDAGAPTWFGGPVQPQIGTVLFSSVGGPSTGPGEAADGIEAALVLAGGISVTQHVGDLGRLAGAPPERFRLLLGYAGWGEGQLLEEILRNDWLTAPVDADLVFAASPEEAWTGALRSVGVNPASLPSWTAAGGDGSAN
jgi:putative transcriptional regulator